MNAPEPRFIAVDWGTTRMRASLVDRGGVVTAHAQSDAGVQSVSPGGFPAALRAACGPWFEAYPGLPVVMAGMVGSRNGWIEAPYLHCPCGLSEVAGQLTAIGGLGRDVLVVPGVDMRWEDGSYDVMRGEETQVFGTGVDDGLVCLPGTHSKWVEMAGGRMTRFASFVTGELYAALSGSFVARLAEAPDDPEAGQAEAATATRAGGGLIRALFQARTRVLAGDMSPRAVRPFLSRLLVETEVAGAAELFGQARLIHLLASDPQLSVYRRVLESRGLAVSVVDPATATLAGLNRIMAART